MTSRRTSRQSGKVRPQSRQLWRESAYQNSRGSRHLARGRIACQLGHAAGGFSNHPVAHCHYRYPSPKGRPGLVLSGSLDLERHGVSRNIRFLAKRYGNLDPVSGRPGLRSGATPARMLGAGCAGSGRNVLPKCRPVESLLVQPRDFSAVMQPWRSQSFTTLLQIGERPCSKRS